MRLRYSMALSTAAALSAPAFGAELQLKLELPKLTVADYKKPYVAVWLEQPADQSAVANLAVWYDLKKRDNGGTKWLKDLRTWWRKSGRDVRMPVDGVSGATRSPGTHAVTFKGDLPALAALPAGDYALVVEAAREDGGREVQRLPFKWPAAAQTVRVAGEHELGAVQLEVKP
jgi:hypothetical protein